MLGLTWVANSWYGGGGSSRETLEISQLPWSMLAWSAAPTSSAHLARASSLLPAIRESSYLPHPSNMARRIPLSSTRASLASSGWSRSYAVQQCFELIPLRSCWQQGVQLSWWARARPSPPCSLLHHRRQDLLRLVLRGIPPPLKEVRLELLADHVELLPIAWDAPSWSCQLRKGELLECLLAVRSEL